MLLGVTVLLINVSIYGIIVFRWRRRERETG